MDRQQTSSGYLYHLMLCWGSWRYRRQFRAIRNWLPEQRFLAMSALCRKTRLEALRDSTIAWAPDSDSWCPGIIGYVLTVVVPEAVVPQMWKVV